MHIAPYDNRNEPIVDVDDAVVPLNYFNIVKLKARRDVRLPRARLRDLRRPRHRHRDVETGGETFAEIGKRGVDVWDGEPEGVYVPTDTGCRITCLTDKAETFVAGAKYAETLKPFAVRATSSTRCNTARTTPRRTARSSTSSAPPSRPGRPPAGVGAVHRGRRGGWSGFPSHKHDTDRSEGGEDRDAP
jgi:5-deoxy-glucuronate isomerase